MQGHSTKETLLGLNQAEYLGASTLTQLSTVSPKLAEVYSVVPPSGEGEGPPTPDFDKVQGSNAGLLAHANGELRTTSFFYRTAKVKVIDLRKTRDNTAEELQDVYRALKLRAESAYGRKKLALLGLAGQPADNVTALREQLRDVADRASASNVTEALGPPRPLGIPIDFEAVVVELREKLEVLEQLMKDLTEAEKVRDEAFAAKKAAQDRHRRVRINVARIQEGYYRLAGLDELADRIRFTVRSRSARTATPGPVPEPGAEPVPAPEPVPGPDPSAGQPPLDNTTA